MSDNGVADEIISEPPQIMLINFEAWKYVDPFFNKQSVFHKVFVMEGEPVSKEFCVRVPEWLSKLMPRG